MKEEKGILGKLLSVVGAVLMVIGVFVFQGLSRAEDEVAPGAGGDVNVSIPNNEENEASENSEATGDEAGEVAQPAVEYNYKIMYYVADSQEVLEADPWKTQNETSTENEYKFAIVEDIPEGIGDFLGWYKYENEKVGEYYKALDEVTLNNEEPELKLIAKFAKLETYAIRYNANAGVGAPGAQACESYFGSCEFTLSNVVPTKEGHEFRGWAVNGDGSQIYAPGAILKSASVDEPLTLYAVWAEIKTYTLMYDVNGGSGHLEVQACKSASGSCQFTLSEVTPTKNAAVFLGWRRGEETLSPGATITVTETNTILIADWNPIYTFVLNYVSEEGTQNLPDAQKCETATGTCTFIISDKEPVRDGYIFRGWRLEDKEDMLAKAGDELVVAIDNPLDLKIRAVWSKLYAVLNSGEVFGAGERVILRSVANYGNFEKLVIDSEEVPMEYFKISESETTSITLSNAFSQSLSSGEHGFTITWKDGEANGIISVNQSEDGTKRFLIVDATGNTDGAGLVYRPKAGAVSKESSGVVADAATGNEESNFDAVRTLVIVAVAAFVVIYIVNRFYVRHKMDFIEEF